MKTPYTLALSATLLSLAGLSFADDDIGPDQALKLVEAGTIMPFDELNEVVLDLHPDATVEETELELEYGRYVYQVELRAGTPSQEWDVALDAATGEVLEDRRDD